MMRSFITSLIILLLTTFTPGHAQAHGTGASLEREAGAYIIDIGYEPETLVGQEPAVFDFDLLDKNTKNKIDFGNIWVRIIHDKQTVFATGIQKTTLGATTLVYTFPKEGDYELSVRFQKGEERLAETTFPIRVLAAENPKQENTPFVWGIGGLVLGIAASLLLKLFGAREKSKTI